MVTTFLDYWSQFRDKPLQERQEHFSTLSKNEQKNILQSFFSDGWAKFFVQNHIEYLLDYVKEKFAIDLLDMRIKARKLKKVFLVDRKLWEIIEDLFFEFQDYYNVDIIFGDLMVSPWGKRKQFFKIRSK